MEKNRVMQGVSKELTTLRDLVEELGERPNLGREEMRYCDRRLREVESHLKKLRRRCDDTDYSGVAVCSAITRIQ